MCYIYSTDIHKGFNAPLKLVRTFFKRFTSLPFFKLSFFLYAPITSEESHAWFHLNAASPAARNTEQVNIAWKTYS